MINTVYTTANKTGLTNLDRSLMAKEICVETLVSLSVYLLKIRLSIIIIFLQT